MNKRLLFLLPLLFVFGCQPRVTLPPEALQVMNAADSYEIVALAPKTDAKPDDELFQGYPIRGRCSIASAKDQNWMTKNIERGIVEQPENSKFGWPQLFGVRTKQGDRTVDLFYDYQTYTITLFWDGKQRTYTTSHTPLGMFRMKLAQAGQLPKK